MKLRFLSGSEVERKIVVNITPTNLHDPTCTILERHSTYDLS